MPSCLIGLGSNLGDRRAMLDAAVARLARHPAIAVTAQSPWFETSPVGGPPGQPLFLNGAAVVETSLSPQALLEVLQDIEAALGRRPGPRWDKRPIDLDLLLYQELVLSTPSLVLPHPRMAWRRFVLKPAALVAGDMVHPTIGWTVARLFEHLDTATPYVAITGSIGAGKTQLAGRLAAQLDAPLLAEPLDLKQLEAFYADPASQAWNTELQFLHVRTRLLASGSSPWTAEATPVDTALSAEQRSRQPKQRLVISDFWFDQSLAFARVWLPPEQSAAFRRQWEQSRHQVVQPKLTVVLDAPAEELLQRILRRGRRCERNLTVKQLEQIRQSIRTQASAVGLGPVLYINTSDWEAASAEALAAIEAMQ